MLDKSLPYLNLIMHRAGNLPAPTDSLPSGFRFRHYRPGLETAWAEIETAVLEFDSVGEATDYFAKHYLGTPELAERAVFVVDADGECVATATGWTGTRAGRTVPALHWIGVRPEFQGLGLGKAVVARAVEILQSLHGDQDMYLHTQTWSYKAVGVYLDAGFRFLTDDTFDDNPNDFTAAVPILRQKLKAPYASLMGSAGREGVRS